MGMKAKSDAKDASITDLAKHFLVFALTTRSPTSETGKKSKHQFIGDGASENMTAFTTMASIAVKEIFKDHFPSEILTHCLFKCSVPSLIPTHTILISRFYLLERCHIWTARNGTLNFRVRRLSI